MFKLDKEGKQILARELAKKVSHYDIRKALQDAITLILKEEDIKKLLPNAIEKATKDIARWKLVRENIYYGIQLEKINSKIDDNNKTFEQVIKEVLEYKDIMKHLKEQEKLLKT